MNGLKLHLTNDPPSPTSATSTSGQAASTTAASSQATAAPDKDSLAKEEMVLGVLEMYTQKDVWTSVADNTKFATCKQKWEEIKCIYGGVGSMSSFNT